MQELEGVAWKHRWDYLNNICPHTVSIFNYLAGFMTVVLSFFFCVFQCSLYRDVNVTMIYSHHTDVSKDTQVGILTMSLYNTM